MKKCECGNTKFYAHQICYNAITVDGDNFFIENHADCSEAETPYGPYECTECRKEYENLD